MVVSTDLQSTQLLIGPHIAICKRKTDLVSIDIKVDFIAPVVNGRILIKG